MTREEMRIKREIKKTIEKDFLKPISKKNGYKIISGVAYVVYGDWIYTINVFNTHEWIMMTINVKPIAIDNLFWKIFEIYEDASKRPFSFHVNAAFIPYSLQLEEWKVPVATSEQVESVLDQAFIDANNKISMYCEKIKTIQDFKELVLNEEHINYLNCILCDIVLRDYKSALNTTEEELSKNHSGGFVSIQGGDIYEYVIRYCKKQM